jgi:hypothetical protein
VRKVMPPLRGLQFEGGFTAPVLFGSILMSMQRALLALFATHCRCLQNRLCY